MSPALVRYVELLDELLWRRAVDGTLPDEIEEAFVVAMNDCRRHMTAEDEERVAELVARRKAVGHRQLLGLVDTDPAQSPDGRLRIEAA